MAFTFIHTADWQLGKAFAQFGTELGARLRQARLDAIDAIADAARTHGAKHVLVAGDIWEHCSPDNTTLHHALERLAKHQQLNWWMLPGNHDPAEARGVWDRLASGGDLKCPDNVHLLLRSEPVEIADGVVVMPAPLLRKDPTDDPTRWMNDCKTPPGTLRIGLAHGAMDDFGQDGDDHSRLINPARAEQAHLDYLALGDWHGKKQIDARTWYSGTPEADRFRNNDPGWCLAVTISGSNQPQVIACRTGKFTWSKLDIVVHPGKTADDIWADVSRDDGLAQDRLIDLTLSGQISARDVVSLERLQSVKTDALAYLTVDRASLQILIEPDDIASLELNGSVRAVAERLAGAAQDKTTPEQQRKDAVAALSLFLTLADEVKSGGTA